MKRTPRRDQQFRQLIRAGVAAIDVAVQKWLWQGYISVGLAQQPRLHCIVSPLRIDELIRWNWISKAAHIGDCTLGLLLADAVCPYLQRTPQNRPPPFGEVAWRRTLRCPLPGLIVPGPLSYDACCLDTSCQRDDRCPDTGELTVKNGYRKTL